MGSGNSDAFRRLNLAITPRIYQQVADRAEKENWSYRDFLAFLLAEEVAHRKQTRLQRCTRSADRERRLGLAAAELVRQLTPYEP